MFNHNRSTTGRIVSNYAVRVAVVVAVLLAGVTVGAGSAVAEPVSSVDTFPEADSLDGTGDEVGDQFNPTNVYSDGEEFPQEPYSPVSDTEGLQPGTYDGDDSGPSFSQMPSWF